MAACPRCTGRVSDTAAVCPHCDAYLLDWDASRGALGPVPDDGRQTPDAHRGSVDPTPSAPSGLFSRRPPRPPRVTSTRATIAVLRLLCGVAMAVHGLIALIGLVEPSLALIAWIVLWLPLDGFHRAPPLRRP